MSDFQTVHALASGAGHVSGTCPRVAPSGRLAAGCFLFGRRFPPSTAQVTEGDAPGWP
jgi:hypothetical protein